MVGTVERHGAAVAKSFMGMTIGAGRAICRGAIDRADPELCFQKVTRPSFVCNIPRRFWRGREEDKNGTNRGFGEKENMTQWINERPSRPGWPDDLRQWLGT